jgi:hypothetical protein
VPGARRVAGDDDGDGTDDPQTSGMKR